MAVAEEAEVPDAVKTVRQHMDQEATDGQREAGIPKPCDVGGQTMNIASDHVAIFDDVGALAAARGASRARVISGVPPMNTSGRSSYSRTLSRWPMSRDGTV
jgi:hypothetical protein